MRNLTVFESVSVDGYFADASNDMSFAHAVEPDSEFAAWVADNASGDYDLLFGRKTYEMMQAFWTSPVAMEQMPAAARGMNAATKYVVSQTLQPTWANSQLLPGDPMAAVQALKRAEGPPIVVFGSGSLVSALSLAGLVDEYQFVVIPIALGGGRTLFTGPAKLRLMAQRTFKNGNVVLTYAA